MQEERAQVSQPTKVGGILALLGGVLAAIGSLLPWETVSVSFFGSGSRNGIGRGWGVASLIGGLVVAILGVMLITGAFNAKVSAWIALAGGLAILVVGIAEVLSVRNSINDTKKLQQEINLFGGNGGSSLSVHTSIGVGLWLVVAGGVLVLVGGVWRSKTR